MISAPAASEDDAFFWDGARRGELLIQRCAACHTLRHPPGPMCGHCHSLAWDTVASSGRATVHSWIVSRHPSRPEAEPRIVALVDLEEGTRLVTNLVAIDLGDVHVGMPVAVTFLHADGFSLPQFRPERLR